MIREIDNITSNPFARRIEYIIDDKVIGYLEYSLIYDRIEIDNIEVDSLYRGNGIGTKLMEYLINLANDLKVVNITLEVRVSNSVAIKLYKNFGFEAVAKRQFYYGDEDGILMEKKVI